MEYALSLFWKFQRLALRSDVWIWLSVASGANSCGPSLCPFLLPWVQLLRGSKLNPEPITAKPMARGPEKENILVENYKREDIY